MGVVLLTTVGVGLLSCVCVLCSIRTCNWKCTLDKRTRGCTTAKRHDFEKHANQDHQPRERDSTKSGPVRMATWRRCLGSLPTLTNGIPDGISKVGCELCAPEEKLVELSTGAECAGSPCSRLRLGSWRSLESRRRRSSMVVWWWWHGGQSVTGTAKLREFVSRDAVWCAEVRAFKARSGSDRDRVSESRCWSRGGDVRMCFKSRHSSLCTDDGAVVVVSQWICILSWLVGTAAFESKQETIFINAVHVVDLHTYKWGKLKKVKKWRNEKMK